MAAVAPAQTPAFVETVPDDEAAATAAPTSENNMDADSPHDDDHDDHEDDDEEENEEVIKEWDEGGKSHCGYGDSVHETLMSIGESIHKVVGEPSEGIDKAMKGVGNWFQEASYAARDLQRGKMDVAEEAAGVMKTMVSGDEDDNKEEGEETKGSEDGEEKLEPLQEEPSKEDASSCA